VFAPSARRISPKEVGRITAQLRGSIEKIGVFVNQTPEIILDTVEKARLSGVQLQGDETPEAARELKKSNQALKVIKTVHMRESQIAQLELDEMGIYDGLLFDSGTKENRGGTGVTFDWNENAPMIRFLGRKFRVIIAGGLKPENVSTAIKTFSPAGVDVVTGVESAPGKKDPGKIKAFIDAARGAEAA
jgi:phosphoribosylanthranilate isomerase